jgi:hypothetical protein
VVLPLVATAGFAAQRGNPVVAVLGLLFAALLFLIGIQLMDRRHIAELKSTAEDQRCRVHGKTASLEARRSGTRIRFLIHGCCEDLIREAKAAVEVNHQVKWMSKAEVDEYLAT